MAQSTPVVGSESVLLQRVSDVLLQDGVQRAAEVLHDGVQRAAEVLHDGVQLAAEGLVQAAPALEEATSSAVVGLSEASSATVIGLSVGLGLAGVIILGFVGFGYLLYRVSG